MGLRGANDLQSTCPLPCRRDRESKAMNQGDTARGAAATPFKPNYISKNETAQKPQENAWHEGDPGGPVRCCDSADCFSLQTRGEARTAFPYLLLHWSQPHYFQGSKKATIIPGELYYFPKPPAPPLTLLYQQLGWRLNNRSTQSPGRTGSPFCSLYSRLHIPVSQENW